MLFLRKESGTRCRWNERTKIVILYSSMIKYIYYGRVLYALAQKEVRLWKFSLICMDRNG